MPSASEVYRFVVGSTPTPRSTSTPSSTPAPVTSSTRPGSPRPGPGLARAVAWISAHRRRGRRRARQREGTGSYGARLAKVLGQSGYSVVDAPAPKRDRGGDKNDSIDAIKAARSTLASKATGWPTCGPVTCSNASRSCSPPGTG